MSRLVFVLFLVAVVLVALAVVAPALVRLMGALVPLTLVIGVVIGVLRLVWAYTRRW